MKITPSHLPDVKLIEPKVFEDSRGYFYEGLRLDLLKEALGQPVQFVQQNFSKSRKGTLRGLHYQLPPRAQGKLVRVSRGEIFDIAVDIRKSSPQFGLWVGMLLSEKNRLAAYIPPGFAHGFVTLSEVAEMSYLTTDYYSPEHDRGIRFDDPDININWGFSGELFLSDKDKNASAFKAAQVFS